MIQIHESSQYRYVDSSESEEDAFNKQSQQTLHNSKSESSEKCYPQIYNHHIIHGQAPFIESSSDQSSTELEPKKNRKLKNNNKRMCKVNSDAYLLGNHYLDQLYKVVQINKQKIGKKAPLLVPNDDAEILANLDKRSKNYGYFLKTLEIDKKYKQILNQKTAKVREQNLKKKQVLQKKKIMGSMQQEETELKKYVLDKKLKEQIVVDKVKKYAYKLGIEKVRNEEKHLKSETRSIQKKAEMKMANLEVQQKNRIQELRQQLEEAKEAKRINKIDQTKAIRQMEHQNQKNKNLLLTKVEKPGAKNRNFVV